MRVYKFVTWDVNPAMTDYTLEKFIKNYDKSCSAVHDALAFGHLKLGGWCYDFSDELNKFLYKDYYGDWHEVYAPNKTAIRNAVYGRILKIVELERKVK